MNKITKTMRDSDEFASNKIQHELNDLEVHRWRDGGDFEEIRDLSYCQSNLEDLFKQSQTNLLTAIIEEIEEQIQKERFAGAPFLGNKIQEILKDSINN